MHANISQLATLSDTLTCCLGKWAHAQTVSEHRQRRGRMNKPTNTHVHVCGGGVAAHHSWNHPVGILAESVLALVRVCNKWSSHAGCEYVWQE
eukprot:364356-Chlamydomonas_euryale.AAC.2